MNRVPLAAGAGAILVVVIGGGILLSQLALGDPVTSPSLAPSPLPPPASGIVLQRAPTNLGCDAIDPGYRSATIHIDPESDIYLDIADPAWDGTHDRANVDVWAEADNGARLAVYWTAGFNATDGNTPVIRGPRGEEVARDGAKIDEEFTRLTGYFTCGGPDALFVLEYAAG